METNQYPGRKVSSYVTSNPTVEWVAFREGATMPAYKTAGAAGFDISAWLGDGEVMRIAPQGTAIVPTGLNLRIQPGYELQVRSRSGLSAKKPHVHVLNSPGTIDEDYVGNGEDFELKIILHNTSATEWFHVGHGDRIAQGVVSPVVRATMILRTEPFEDGASGGRVGGLGSTGK
jgi:dUTP pyrophosphatase